MKASRAIEIIEVEVKCLAFKGVVDRTKAFQLGIEALKWVKRYRPDNKTDRWGLLPGETK